MQVNIENLLFYLSKISTPSSHATDLNFQQHLLLETYLYKLHSQAPMHFHLCYNKNLINATFHW